MDDDKRDEVYVLCVVGDQSDIVTQDQVMDSATSKPYFYHTSTIVHHALPQFGRRLVLNRHGMVNRDQIMCVAVKRIDRRIL